MVLVWGGAGLGWCWSGVVHDLIWGGVGLRWCLSGVVLVWGGADLGLVLVWGNPGLGWC